MKIELYLPVEYGDPAGYSASWYLPVEETVAEEASEYFVGVSDIADRVVERMNHSLIPSALPKHMGEAFKKAAQHGQQLWIHNIPLWGPECVTMQYTISPDGSLTLEMRDLNGQHFWRGTFRPVS